jgi:predicted TIM-barrel fold metal-dependent hydrolase
MPWIISVDDHVIEHPRVWQDRLPKKYLEIGPRIVSDANGEAWRYEDLRWPTFGLSVTAGKKKEDYKAEYLSFADMRPGCYDPVERAKDMDSDHVIAEMCFPSFPRFCGQTFAEADDKVLALLCVQAYNDFILDEWCTAVPGRFIPLVIMPLWDPQLAVTEIERCAAKGARAVCFSENPTKLGLPSIHSREKYWDPVFRAVSDASMPLAIHVGSSSETRVTSPDAPKLVSSSIATLAATPGAMMDWIFNDSFIKYPNLKVCLSEGNIGWIPYALEQADFQYRTQRFWSLVEDVHFDKDGRITSRGPAPLEYTEIDVYERFREHIFGCFVEDYFGAASIGAIGAENVMLETDYPHSVSTFPNTAPYVEKALAHLSDEDAWQVCQGNARRIFAFQPAVRT